jgi:hypothetical protein
MDLDGAGDRIVYRQNFVDPESEVDDAQGNGTAYASVVADMAPGADLLSLRLPIEQSLYRQTRGAEV